MAYRLKQKPVRSRGSVRDVSVDLRELYRDTGTLSDVTVTHDYTDIVITDAQISDADLDILGATVPTGQAVAFRSDLTNASGSSYVLLVTVSCTNGEIEPFEVELICK